MTNTILDDIQGAAELHAEDIMAAELQRNKLLEVQDIVASRPDFKHPVVDELIGVVLKDIDLPSTGLESLSPSNPLVLSASIESLNAQLTVSQEGWFDFVKSYNTKADEFIKEAENTLRTIRSAVKPGERAEVDIHGTYKNLPAAITTLENVVGCLLGDYKNDIKRTSEVAAEYVRKYFVGRANLTLALSNIKKLTVKTPAVFKAAGFVDSSEVLLGGSQLSIVIDGRKSDFGSTVENVKSTVEVTGNEVIKACDDISKLLTLFTRYVKAREANTKTVEKVNRSGDVGLIIPFVTGAVFATMGLPAYFAAVTFTDPKVRRRWRLLFEDNHQKERYMELRTAVRLIDESGIVLRHAISELESISKKLESA